MGTNTSKPRVLVVDDEPAIVELLCARLSEEGFACCPSTSGEDAIRRLNEKPFDAVVSDLRMPGVSGLALLEKVAKQHPQSAFLMVTGESDVRVGVKAMQEGASNYLVKPCTPEAVVHSVRQALEKKHLELELDKYRHRLEQMVEERTEQLRQALRQVEETYDTTLQALGAALEVRDAGTGGHSSRVYRYAAILAKMMGCTGDELKQIVRGAALHDIGKIGIPDGILLKKEKLTEEERAVMETHPRIGCELVRRIPFLTQAAEIVLTHQERYDGSGYPQQLAGEAIPLGARIFAVADALDAMTSDRPYRKALPFDVAREEIARESGHQFDPAVVHSFLSLPQELWETIRLEAA